MIDGKFLKDGSILPAKIDLSTASATSHPATRQYVIDTAQALLDGQSYKSPCRAGSSTNISISSAPEIVGGVTLLGGNRILLYGQTTASENGIYVFASTGAGLTRATDANTSAEFNGGMMVFVQEGTYAKVNFKLVTTGAITLGVTVLSFEQFSSVTSSVLTTANKEMQCLTTTNNGDLACNTGINSSLAGGSFIFVIVSGLVFRVGDGVKTKDSYFSSDAGATSKFYSNITSGDKLYWNGSIAGGQLAVTDVIDFIYQS